MGKIYIGIDPSISSTGITVQRYEETYKEIELLYIVHAGKLTKTELAAEGKYTYFEYKVYDKHELKEAGDNNFERETIKTNNLLNVVALIDSILKMWNIPGDEIYIVMEGISYGSTKTSSLMELAGLNYLIRSAIFKYDNIKLFIAPPAEVKKWVTGLGTASKYSMINAFKSVHPDFVIPKIDDIADSYFMSCYAKYITDRNE